MGKRIMSADSNISINLPSKVWYLLLAIMMAVLILLIVISYRQFFYPEQKTNKLNISCFAYRDINRNAIYDMEDRPYAGLPIKMHRPADGPVIKRSNISGFTNFIMSLNNEEVPVSKPGKYTVEVRPPWGWIITSGNTRQTLNFLEMKQAPAGIVVENTCVPIGVAPELRISGSVDINVLDSKTSGLVINAVSSSGKTHSVPVSSGGDYSFSVTADDWKLELIANGTRVSGSESRKISVKNYAVVASRFNADRDKQLPKPHKIIADFDTLTASDTLYELPYGYASLHWINWISTHQKFYKGAGFINATVSSEYMAYNSSGHPATVFSDEPFDFVGTYIGVAWPNAEKHEIVVQGLRKDELVYEDKFKGSTAGAVYFAADYRGVTRIVFASEANWQLVIDDAEFRTGK